MRYGSEFPFLLHRHVITVPRFKWCYIYISAIFATAVRSKKRPVRASAGVRERRNVSKIGARGLLILSVTCFSEAEMCSVEPSTPLGMSSTKYLLRRQDFKMPSYPVQKEDLR